MATLILRWLAVAALVAAAVFAVVRAYDGWRAKVYLQGDQVGAARVRALIGDEVWQTLTPAAQAGLVSWCGINLGLAKCAPSTAIRELRAGRRNEACAAITMWIRDNGRDCRDRANGCMGQVTRRQLEDELCLIGSQS